jgi:hypothetical protein
VDGWREGEKKEEHAPEYPIDEGYASIVAGVVKTNLPAHLLRPRVTMLGGVLDVESEEVSPFIYEPVADTIGPISDVPAGPSPNVRQSALACEGVGHTRQPHDEGQATFYCRCPGRNGTERDDKGRL